MSTPVGRLIDPAPGRLVQEALTKRRYFGDSAPRWTGCKTAAESDAEWAALLKRLRRFGPRTVGCFELHDVISRCKSDSACFSGACPRCQRAIQRFAVETGCHALVQLPTRALTILPSAWRVQQGQLRNVSIKALKTELVECIRGVYDGPLLGGIEVDLSDENERNGEIVWQVHAHVALAERKCLAVGNELKHRFPSKHAKRPFLSKSLTASNYAASYLVKSHFCRKEFYWAGNEWRNSKRRLSADDDIELVRWLARNGLQSRLIMRNLSKGTTRTA